MIRKYAIYSINTKLHNIVPGLTDLTNERPELYDTYKKNEHHWTTNWTFQHFIPRFLYDVHIDFSPNHFKKISCIYDEQDLSYHIPISDNLIDTLDLYSNTKKQLYIKDLIFNKEFNSPLGASTGYHRLFLYSHRCCKLYNPHSITNRSLLLNTDSMSVPIIPILISYFRSILVLDNRTNASYKTLINQWTQQNISTMTYVELFIADSYNFHKYAINLK